ncbi:16S rRNA (guanine(527)-N(7))-methyltransferase RsmG [Sneathiella chinensis]|uniref:Ribosomal RNA small subunit methyltransferase G n=1 Tax=Sneathiella chinensis TaxID=349750 RepID=A0ABQ5TZP8_9PROT|nr:16S rRNA (guanine(527)-N(7))-methyltransferase RsmG [Sneathiella chinensis]GLQ04948.1 ribosomal RNA small subunit methyltransferase G [Sneathiella chinensis]
MNKSEFQSRTNVSRETLEKLEIYVNLLNKWQKAINLVSRSTLSDAWLRHILDSYQVLDHVTAKEGIWIDLGSGAGFPALVVAIVSDFDVHVVESDQRKCLFMREVSRETSSPITVHNSRIEAVSPFPADVISARALASLDRLLEYSVPFATEKTEFLFLKGQDVDAELTNASKCWKMDAIKYQSVSSSEGSILKLTNVRHSG